MKRIPRLSISRISCQRRSENQPRRWLSTTATASSSAAPNLDELRNRPSKFIPDYLTPMPSHLLTTTLSDLLQHQETPISSPRIQSPPQSLPQGHHLVYFPIQTAPSKLAVDGADPDHSPGKAFPRRMWAGGEVIFHRGWREALAMDGKPWACREEIGDVRAKGNEGDEKVFVDVWRRYGLGHEDGGEGSGREWQVEERRTLVFMRDEGPATTSSPTPRRLIKFPHKPTSSSTVKPTPTHLFHFSALTFNAHSIHLDPLYAKSTDGHRDLLVHGPLTLALMLRQLQEQAHGGSVARITYRNHAPLYVNEPLTVCVRQPEGKDRTGTWDVWVEGPEGGLAVKGSAVMET